MYTLKRISHICQCSQKLLYFFYIVFIFQMPVVIAIVSIAAQKFIITVLARDGLILFTVSNVKVSIKVARALTHCSRGNSLPPSVGDGPVFGACNQRRHLGITPQKCTEKKMYLDQWACLQHCGNLKPTQLQKCSS